MACDPELAFELARTLWSVPDFPRTKEVTEAIALDLHEMCADDDEARWIVSAARKWERWAGTAGLVRLLKDKRIPFLAPERRVIDLGPKPVINCAACQDWGYTWRGGRNEYCSCAEGVRMQTEATGFLEKLNQAHAKGPLALQAVAPRRPISEADLEQAFLERQKETDTMIARAKAVLADEARSGDEKELARETLRTLGAEE